MRNRRKIIVGVDARLALARGRGWGRYAIQFLRSLGRQSSVWAKVLLPNDDASRFLGAGLGPSVTCVYSPFNLALDHNDYLSESMSALDLAKALGHIDLFHSLTRFVARTRFRPVIATVHDIAPLSDPPFKTEVRNSTLRALSRLRQYECNIITVSDFTKQELVRYGGLGEERIKTIHPGAGTVFSSPPAPGRPPTTSSSASRGRTYKLLYVGGAGDNKNIDRLLRCAETLSRQLPLELNLVGAYEWGYAAHLAGRRDHGLYPFIRFHDYVTDDQLRDLYVNSDLFVFPSLHEGFGLPVLEAMAHRLPVCCSDIAIMREVAGPAARYFDPHDMGSMVAAIKDSIEDHEKTDRLVHAGLNRSTMFSWHTAVAETIGVYRDVVAAHRRRSCVDTAANPIIAR